MLYKVLTVTLAIIFSSITYCHACSCMRTHPQEHYCNSDFVILARVKKEQIINSTGMNGMEWNRSKVYKVRVRKEFKISEKGLVALKSGKIHTAVDSGVCGAPLNIGKLYVISGRIYRLRAETSSCDMIMEWNGVTRRQRKGLKSLYKRGCNCKIRNCYRSCNQNKDSCPWSSNCHTKDGICLRQAHGACMWNKNKMLNSCLSSELKPYQRSNSSNYHYRYPPRNPPIDLMP